MKEKGKVIFIGELWILILKRMREVENYYWKIIIIVVVIKIY